MSTSSESSLSTCPLEQEPFYHGYLPRKDTEDLLEQEGDFIVRMAEGKDKILTVLSVFCSGASKHFIAQRTREGHYYLENLCFTSIGDLVRYHTATKQPLTIKSGAKLLNPIPQQSWELNYENVRTEREIGEGAFGKVYEGILLVEGGRTRKVAIKTCNQAQTRLTFMREARLMRGYSHQNIVQMYGIAAHRTPLLLVLEYIPGGSLKNYLVTKKEKKEEASGEEKITFCLDAAKGMEFLESKKSIHGDLTARHCLLGTKNLVKITDYGFKREEITNRWKGSKKESMTWIAPETMERGEYTTKSDVWSFGILMWEIYSNGKNLDSCFRMQSGSRQAVPPTGTPQHIKDIMGSCWTLAPEKRPTFQTIRKDVQRAKETKTVGKEMKKK